MTRTRSLGDRLRAALVVGDLTLGILVLFLLQFALPDWLGLAGLIAVGFVDAVIFLVVYHRRAVRRREHEIQWVHGGPAARRRSPVKDEYVVTTSLLCFVLGLSIMGFALQALTDHPGSTTDFVLFQVGAVVMLIGYLLFWPYDYRYADWRTESEKYDTTDDH